MTVAKAQAALAGIAFGLVAMADRLQQDHDALPPSPERETMWTHAIPRSP